MNDLIMKELLSSIGQINFELKALMFGDKTPPLARLSETGLGNSLWEGAELRGQRRVSFLKTARFRISAETKETFPTTFIWMPMHY